MKTYTITENEAGQRLDRFLGKLLPVAPASFFYKMLRKKNITLNSKKAEGSYKLSAGDEVRLFLSDETIASFSRTAPSSAAGHASDAVLKARSGSHMKAHTSDDEPRVSDGPAGRITSCPAKTGSGLWQQLNQLSKSDIIFEDKDILIINKPAGMLSQKAKADDISMNELLIAYLLDNGELKPDDMRAFRPAVCNRLDRNTSGVLLAGKSLAGLRFLSELLRSRSINKYYYALVKGEEQPPRESTAYLSKDEKTNTSQVAMKPSDKDSKKYAMITTRLRQLSSGGGYALLEAELITGKSHQIRAQLAAIGHPVIGDAKYGDASVNKLFFKSCHVRRQLLHAERVVFPYSEGFKGVSGKEFVAELPSDFKLTLKALGLNDNDRRT